MCLICLTFVTNLIAYVNIEKQIERQTGDYTTEMLESKKNEIDNMHTQLRRIAYELQNDDVIRKTAFSDFDGKNGYSYNIIEVSNKLNRYSLTLDNFQNVYIYFHNMDYCVGAYKANFSSNFFKVHIAESGINYAKWADTVKSCHTDEFLVFPSEKENGESSVLYMQSIYNVDRFVPYATIVVEIETEKFLPSSEVEEYGEAFAILNENNSIFLSKSAENAKRINDITEKNGANLGISSYKDNVMIAVRSEVNDWKYIYLVDKNVFGKSISNARRQIFIWNLVGILGAVLFSLLNANRNFKPVKRIISPIVKKDNVSMGDLYDAGEMVTKLVLENKKYNSYAQSLQNDAIKGAFLSHLLTEKTKNGNQTEILESLGIVFRHAKYLVALFYINIEQDMFFDDKNDDFDEAYRLARFVILNVLGDLTDEKIIAENCDVNGMLCCIVNLDDEEDAKRFADTVENLREIVHKNFNIRFLAGISNTYDAIDDLSFCYDEAMSCVEKHFFNACGVICYSDINEETAENVLLSSKQEEILLNTISMCDTSAVEKEIDEIFDAVVNSKSKNLTDVKILLYNFIRIMTKIAGDADFYRDNTRVISEITDLIENISIQSGITETKAKLKEIIGKFCASNKTAIKDKTELLIQKAKDMIDQNYKSSQISVSLVAEECGVTAAYLSSKFKKTNGVGVLEYITLKRIELAKKMLLMENTTVEEVSKAVGYESRRSFMRMFTQYAGVSPSRYRTMMLLQEKEERQLK